MNKIVTDIATARVPLNWVQLIMIIIFAVTSTFTLTQIYARFEATEIKIGELKTQIELNKVEINRRLNAKTDRNKLEIENVEKHLLEKKNK